MTYKKINEVVYTCTIGSIIFCYSPRRDFSNLIYLRGYWCRFISGVILFRRFFGRRGINHVRGQPTSMAHCCLNVFMIRRRKEGDRFRPAWRDRPMKLKDFLRGQGVPLHRRDQVALVCDEHDTVRQQHIMYLTFVVVVVTSIILEGNKYNAFFFKSLAEAGKKRGQNIHFKIIYPSIIKNPSVLNSTSGTCG